jgi:hypothetical protein
MLVGTCRGSGETGGLTDGLLLVRFGEESAGSAQCVRGRVDVLRCVTLPRAAWCVRRMQVGLTVYGAQSCCPCKWGCCHDELLPRAELLVMTLVLMILLVLSASLLEARIFIPLPLGWVRASWRRSWSCGRWLGSACVGVQATGRELQCINTACAHYAVSVWPKEFPCLLDCDWRSLAVCMTVSLKEFGCLYDCGRFPRVY